MAFDLKVREARLFEEKVGQPFTRVMGKLGASVCQDHKLLVKACEECGKAKGMCEAHLQAFNDCNRCAGAEIPTEVAAALVWIFRLRRDAQASYDDIEEMSYVDMVSELGGQMAGSPTTA